MWLVMVDGWQASSIGMTADELAAFLLARGAYIAMALDGGSSSALVLEARSQLAVRRCRAQRREPSRR